MNKKLIIKRRTDFESSELEIIWLEVFPFKSKRSLLMSGIYRPPSYLKAGDIAIEANLEQAYFLNKEIILLGDFNINFHDSKNYNKHRLGKGLKNMNHKQLVKETTRPISGRNIIDHILSNQPQRIKNGCRNILVVSRLIIYTFVFRT